MFLTDADITASLRAVLKLAAAEPTPDWWTQLVKDAHSNAWSTILAALGSRGYTEAAISGWARGPEFERSLSLYWLLTTGNLLEEYPDLSGRESRLDRREELKTVSLTDLNGNRIKVGTGVVGTGSVAGGFADVRAKDPNRRTGFLAPDGSGRFMNW